MAEASIRDKARQALIAVITAADVGTDNIVNSNASAEKAAPFVGCGCSRAEEDPVGSGNFWCDLEVVVKSIAAVDTDGTDPKAAADSLEDNVLEVLKGDNLAEQLSDAVANFHCYGFGEGYSEEESQEGDVWVTTWKRRAYCMGIDGL